MIIRRSYFVAIVAVLCLFAPARAAERIFSLQDHVGIRDWGPELVTYQLTSPGSEFRVDRLTLVDAQGKAVPFQLTEIKNSGGYVTNANVSFVASMPKGGSYRYTLKSSDADGRAAGSTLTIKRAAGQLIEAANALLTVRTPAVQSQTPAQPVDAASVPAPIQGWKRADGGWIGGSSFVTDRKVKSWSIAVAADGPAYKQIDCRYTFAPEGEYLCSVRVVNESAMVYVTEEYNFGAITTGRDFVVVTSGKNVDPAELNFLAPVQDGLSVRQSGPLAKYLEDKRAAAAAPVAMFTPPKMQPIAAGDLFLENIVPAATFGLQSGVGLAGGANRFAFVPLFAGSWRRAQSSQFWYSDQDKFKFLLPISVRLSHWYSDMADDESPFSTHEHDRGLPPSYGRRVWGLYLGDEPLDAARMRYGFIGLDRLKDWVLDWKDDKSYTFPRAWLTPKQVAEAKQQLAANPFAKLDAKVFGDKQLDKLYPFNPSRDAAIAGLAAVPGWFVRWSVFYPDYRHAYESLWTQSVDLALSCPDLPADRLADARAKTAFIAYGHAEPDFNLRTYGGHQGNPNMPINRNTGLLAYAALIPGHPHGQEWANIVYEYARWKMGSMTDPSGAWGECPSYMIYGPERFLHWNTIVSKNLGYDTSTMIVNERASLTYLMNLSATDPRYGGRIIPGMGNGAPLIDPIFGQCTPLFQDEDPAFAGQLKWMHEQIMGKTVAQPRPDWTARWASIQSIQPKLESAFFPGYGVVFRNHFNDPQETVLLFRQGYVKGHWDTDDGNILFYAKGMPVVPGQAYQYGPQSAANKDYISFSRVKLGTKGSVLPGEVADPHGRVEKNIQDYGFLPAADYALGQTDYPAGLFKMEPKGKSWWNRHILFIKSANPGGDYFVMRDTFGGAPRPSWWHLQPLSKREQVQIGTNTIDAATDWGVSLNVWFAGGKPLQAATYPYEAPMAPHGADAEMARTWAEKVPNHLEKELRTVVQLAKPAGEDYFSVFYPHKPGEPVAKSSELGNVGAKVVTAESTDYAFINDEPVKYNADGVLFEGRAGVVRVYADHVSLAMNSGSGRIGYKGYVVSGHGPFQKDVAIKDLKAYEDKIDGGYEKKIVSKTVGDVTIRGEEPFTAVVADGAITIQTDGRRRVFTITKPAWILKPRMTFDGKPCMICWTDEAGSDWGRLEECRIMAAATLDGKHTLVIDAIRYPIQFPRTFDVRLTNTKPTK